MGLGTSFELVGDPTDPDVLVGWVEEFGIDAARRRVEEAVAEGIDVDARWVDALQLVPDEIEDPVDAVYQLHFAARWCFATDLADRAALRARALGDHRPFTTGVWAVVDSAHAPREIDEDELEYPEYELKLIPLPEEWVTNLPQAEPSVLGELIPDDPDDDWELNDYPTSNSWLDLSTENQTKLARYFDEHADARWNPARYCGSPRHQRWWIGFDWSGDRPVDEADWEDDEDLQWQLFIASFDDGPVHYVEEPETFRGEDTTAFVHPSGDWVIVGDDRGDWLFSVDGEQLHLVLTPDDGLADGTISHYSPTGDLVVVLPDTRVYRVEDGRPVGPPLVGADGEVEGICWMPGEDRFVAKHPDGDLLVGDLTGGRLRSIERIRTDYPGILELTSDPTGRHWIAITQWEEPGDVVRHGLAFHKWVANRLVSCGTQVELPGEYPLKWKERIQWTSKGGRFQVAPDPDSIPNRDWTRGLLWRWP